MKYANLLVASLLLGLSSRSIIFCEKGKQEFNVPILFLIFNRPDVQQQVFQKIREVQPKKLFIAADGPRSGVAADQEKCAKARKIVEQVDWLCDVKILFRESNLGCDTAVSQAISWFFNHVEEGIILEDDCMPARAFFDFCKTMLERYRYEEQVWNVLGVNYYGSRQSYFFTHNFYSTGWATWRRAWKYFDPWALKNFDEQVFRGKFRDQSVADTWIKFFNKLVAATRAGKVCGFDCQWMYQTLMNDKLCVHAPENTIDIALGCGPDATWFHDANDLRCFFRAKDFESSRCTQPEELKSLYDYKAPLGVEW